MVAIVCAGPGPHNPSSGVLGQSSVAPRDAAFCSAAACQAVVGSVAAAQEVERSNRATSQQQAQTALVNNRAYLALASPTTAHVAAQVKALTLQNQALIRLALQQFDATI